MLNLRFDLTNPQMTLLHRVGLVGLWMTLKNLDRAPTPQGLTWRLGQTGLELFCHSKSDLDWLFKSAFQIEDGIIVLSARRLTERHVQILLHNAILRTFLQHNQSRKLECNPERTEAFVIDFDKPPLILTYKRVAEYKYQTFSEFLWDENKQIFCQNVKLNGWIYPGAIQPHAAVSGSNFIEPLDLALLLPFASIAAYYYVLKDQGGREDYALVLSDCENLPEFYKNWEIMARFIPVQEQYVSSIADAALKCLLSTAQNHCQVAIFKQNSWSKQQRTRTQVAELSLPSIPCKYKTPILEIYKACQNIFPNFLYSSKPQKGKDSELIIYPSSLKGAIVDNILNGRVWYAGFYRKLCNANGTLNRFEGRRLRQMFEQGLEQEIEKIFVSVCHEILRQYFGRLYAEAKREGKNVDFGGEVQKLYYTMRRGKSLQDFRKFLIDFWREGRAEEIEKYWQELWKFINKDWERARDLTVLAFCSYPTRSQNQKTESEESLSIAETVDTQVESML